MLNTNIHYKHKLESKKLLIFPFIQEIIAL